MHPRDARILALARRLAGPRPSFSDAVGALSTAVTRIIPAGRVFVIGIAADGPIVGSAISGIGIAADESDVVIVRVGADGQVLHLDRWLEPNELTPPELVSTHLTTRALAPHAVRAATPTRDLAGVMAKPPRSQARGHA